MSESGGSGLGAAPPQGAGPEGGAGGAGGVQHARSFKLRFAAQRESGRSYVSLVKPRGLPATVTGKFYTCEATPDAQTERRALAAVRALFERGPREALSAPLTESHVYGWWAAPPRSRDPRLSHHVRDSAWLKARLLVLAEDERLKRK